MALGFDPRLVPEPPVQDGLEYRVAVPLEYGPWAQFSPWAFSDRPNDYFYNPMSYPYPALNPYLPKRSGAYIQPGNMDPLAYELVAGTMGQMKQEQKLQLFQSVLEGAFIGAVIGWQKKKLLGALLGAAAGAFLQAVLSHYLSKLGQIDWHPEDPTGGAWEGGGDPIYGDPLGPGESIAVASQWYGSLRPHGF